MTTDTAARTFARTTAVLLVGVPLAWLASVAGFLAADWLVNRRARTHSYGYPSTVWDDGDLGDLDTTAGRVWA